MLSKYLYHCVKSSDEFDYNVIAENDYNVQKVSPVDVKVCGIFHKKRTGSFDYNCVVFDINKIKTYLKPHTL